MGQGEKTKLANGEEGSKKTKTQNILEELEWHECSLTQYIIMK